MGKKTIFHKVNILQCPVCGTSFKMQNTGMECENQHSYKIENGYVSFLKKGRFLRTKETYVAKKNVYFMGVFACLIDRVAKFIDKYCNKKIITILDDGCREGTFLCQLCDLLESEFERDLLGMGIDSSKEAIEVATSITKNHLWCVADPKTIPVKGKVFDVITGVFGQMCYEECLYCLQDDGIVVQAFFGEQHFKEIASRELLHDYYGESNGIEAFEQTFEVLEKENVFYSESLTRETMKALMQTGLVEGDTTEEQLKRIENSIDNGLTMDFTILAGKKKLRR